MRHEAAKQMHASERYLLGELNEHDREQFEEHFFTCPECAEDVRMAATLFDNLKVELASDLRAAAPAQSPTLWDRISGWFTVHSLIPAGAALAFAVIAGYQQFVRIPALERAAAPAAAAVSILAPATRGDAPVIPVNRDAPFLPLVLEVNRNSTSPLRWKLVDANGVELWNHTSPAGSAVTLWLPTDKLPDGRYHVVLSSSEDHPLDRYPFQVKRQDDWETR